MGDRLEHAEAAPRARRGYAGVLALTAILALAAWLRLWHIGQAGFGTQYYAAAVLSMLQSWHNFFFNSFDPAGFVSVDKPPLALWLQAGSAALLGFSGWSVHLPQALEGVASVAILHQIVQRRFGGVAALLAALFLAVTPVSIAIDRSNDTDSCLVLFLLASAWTLAIATPSGSRGWLLASMGLLGLAFNAKMLAAIVVLPPFVAVYFLGAPLPWGRKLRDLALGGVLLAVVSLAWCAAYDLTPAQQRPYAGSTRSNSMLELIVGENGLRRFTRGPGRAQTPSPSGTAAGAPADTVSSAAAPAAVPGGAPQSAAASVQPPSAAGAVPDAVPAAAAPATQGGTAQGGGPGGLNGRGRGADRVPIGPLRLASPLLAIESGWLYPLALIAVLAHLWRRRIRLPLEPQDSGMLLWAGWALTYGLVLSFAGGIFHAYYLSALAPAVCALAGIGLPTLWTWYRAGGWRALALPFTLLAVVTWQAYVSHGYLAATADGPGVPAATLRQLSIALLVAPAALALLAAAALLLLLGLKRAGALGWPLGACAAGVVAITLTPAIWAFGTAQSAGNANSPSAQLPGLAGANGFRGNAGRADSQLAAFLTSQHHGERFLAATLSSQQAAPLILATGQPVMAIGGFSGSDPILTTGQLDRLVADGQLRFALVYPPQEGQGGFGGRGAAEQAALIRWIEQHGAKVEPTLWRAPRVQRRPASAGSQPRRRGFQGRRGAAAAALLYDLRPGAGEPAPERE